MKKINMLMVVAFGFAIGSIAYAGPNDSSINVNTAGADELMWLPGISASDAQNIVDFRNSNGPFTSEDDLLRVKGIDKGKLEAFRDYIILEGESTFSAADAGRLGAGDR